MSFGTPNQSVPSCRSRGDSTMKIHTAVGIGMFVLAIALQSGLAATKTNATPAELAARNAAENAALRKEWETWNAPFKPFRIMGNLYYVGPRASVRF